MTTIKSMRNSCKFLEHGWLVVYLIMFTYYLPLTYSVSHTNIPSILPWQTIATRRESCTEIIHLKYVVRSTMVSRKKTSRVKNSYQNKNILKSLIFVMNFRASTYRICVLVGCSKLDVTYCMVTIIIQITMCI